MRKLFTLTLLMIVGCAQEPEFIQRTICAREETRDVQVCHSNTAENAALGAVAGAVGASLLGFKAKHGAFVGGAVGAANGGDSRCHMEKEKFCAEYKQVQEPNPRFKRK